jgi:DNA-binding MarR family transcriptional regulator
MSSRDFDLSTFLPYRLSVLAKRVSTDFARLYGDRFGITIPEWRVLAHLSQHDSVSVREIHQRADMDKSKVSRAAARLEMAGLVEKRVSAGDRRLVSLSLSDKGREMVAAIIPIARGFEREIEGVLGCGEAAEFRHNVERMIAAMENGK